MINLYAVDLADFQVQNIFVKGLIPQAKFTRSGMVEAVSDYERSWIRKLQSQGGKTQHEQIISC